MREVGAALVGVNECTHRARSYSAPRVNRRKVQRLEAAKDQLYIPFLQPHRKLRGSEMCCTANIDFASIAARDHRCAARGREPSRPPVPVARNTKKSRSNHNTNERCINEHGNRQCKSEHLNDQEVSESECREYNN